MPSLIRGIYLIEHSCHKLQKGYAAQGRGDIAMFVLYVVLQLCSMVSARCSLPVPAKEERKDVWFKTLATWNSRCVVHIADNMEPNKMDSIKLLSIMSLEPIRTLKARYKALAASQVIAAGV